MLPISNPTLSTADGLLSSNAFCPLPLSFLVPWEEVLFHLLLYQQHAPQRLLLIDRTSLPGINIGFPYLLCFVEQAELWKGSYHRLETDILRRIVIEQGRPSQSLSQNFVAIARGSWVECRREDIAARLSQSLKPRSRRWHLVVFLSCLRKKSKSRVPC